MQERNKKHAKRKLLEFFIAIGGFILLIAIMIVLFFAFCTPIVKDLEVKEDGYFRYVVTGPNKDPFVAIVGLTETGLKQESLEIPREIDGKPVRRIGYDDDVKHNSYYIYSENLKKIYIHDNIRSIINFEKAYKGAFENGIEVGTAEAGCEKQVSVMICSMNDEFVMSDNLLIKDVYYYGALIDEININRTVAPADIVFMNNYSEEVNNGYYRLDNVETGETIPEPPRPERSGYEFTGWYTETECINEWNFNVSPTIEEGEEFRLYAGWRAL